MISVIMPMYNEELTILESIEEIYNTLNLLRDEWELVVVNDGSTDNSYNIVLEIAKSKPKIKLIGYSINKGRGRALREGFLNAVGDIIVTTEADSSWGTELITKLVTGLKNDPDCDVLIASPYLPGGGYKNVPFIRKFISRIGNKILKLAFSKEFTMSTGMARAYRSEIIKSLDLESNGKDIHIEILSKVKALGFCIKEIPATIDWSLQKRRNNTRRSTLKIRKTIASHLLFSFTEAPILLLGSFSFLFILLGIASGLVVVYTRITSQQDLSRPLINLTLLLLIIGIQLLVFCFLAYQNKKIQNQIVRLHRDILLIKNLNKD